MNTQDRSPSSNDRRVRKTRKALCQGFATLLTQKNIKDISVRELTDLVDLHRGTFYLHYRDIYDLMEQIEQEIIQSVSQILDQFPPQKLGDSPFPMILTLLEYLAENATICKALLSKNGDPIFVERLGLLLRQRCLQNWIEVYHCAQLEQCEFFVAYLVSGCVGVFRCWLQGGMAQSPEQIARMLEDMALHGAAFLERER